MRQILKLFKSLCATVWPGEDGGVGSGWLQYFYGMWHGLREPAETSLIVPDPS